MQMRAVIITTGLVAIAALAQAPIAHGRDVAVFTTAKDTNLRLNQSTPVHFSKATQPREAEISVFVNTSRRFQTFMGIGGAITDASAEVFAKLPPGRQEELLKAYYDKDAGIGYTLARTTIHSSDFASGSYTYIQEGDKTLSTFSIDHDRQYRLPLIKRAIQAAGGKLLLYASPWSPPAFMKSNQSMLKGGTLLPQYRDVWATYFTRFIKAYEREGVPIWGVTIQNEPMAVQTWESNILTATDERDFLRDYLGPIMQREGLGDKKIVVWDHNRDLLSHRANVIFSDPKAAKYAWGIGFHWYETWKGGQPMDDNLLSVAQAFPDKKLMFTEGSVEKFDPAKLNYWPNAERYGRSMIHDFNAGTVAWTDWNILLDERGGPNHVGNFCFAAIHADNRTGNLTYTPTYYYIGHFSKFIKPGAQRLGTTTSYSDLIATSFVNTGGKTASVVMNMSDKPIAYNFIVGEQEAELTIPARAMQTLVF